VSLAIGTFAGPGGWAVAARRLGITEVGIELDAAACATRAAAGHRTSGTDPGDGYWEDSSDDEAVP
jgi:hypothetical protein